MSLLTLFARSNFKMVARLYKSSYGNVYIDGQPLSRWNARSLRSQIEPPPTSPLF